MLAVYLFTVSVKYQAADHLGTLKGNLSWSAYWWKNCLAHCLVAELDWEDLISAKGWANRHLQHWQCATVRRVLTSVRGATEPLEINKIIISNTNNDNNAAVTHSKPWFNKLSSPQRLRCRSNLRKPGHNCESFTFPIFILSWLSLLLPYFLADHFLQYSQPFQVPPRYRLSAISSIHLSIHPSSVPVHLSIRREWGKMP